MNAETESPRWQRLRGKVQPSPWCPPAESRSGSLSYCTVCCPGYGQFPKPHVRSSLEGPKQEGNSGECT